MSFPCPLCKLMAEDYRIALQEADNAGHRDEAELLNDYAEEVGRTLYRHVNTHVPLRTKPPCTPPAPTVPATQPHTVDGGTPN